MVGQRKVLRLVEKWAKNLEEMAPQEILDSAVAIKKVEYVKGDGSGYLELVLEDDGKNYVEVNTRGEIYAQHGDLYVTLKFAEKDVPRLYENLRTLERLVLGD